LVVPGAALLLFISSFLPWYHATATMAGMSESAHQNGWHQIGPVIWILAILVIAFSVVGLLGVLPLDQQRTDLVTVGLSALTILFGVATWSVTA